MIEKEKIIEFLSTTTRVEEGIPKNGWVSQAGLRETVQRINIALESDCKLAAKRLEFLFEGNYIPEESTRDVCNLMKDWHAGKSLFGAPSMVIFALEKFGFSYNSLDFKSDDILVKAMLASSVLAEIPNNLPYHDNLHYRKVLLHVLRMIAVHNNKIFKDTNHKLDKVAIAKLVIAACIHDIGHEGSGNIIDHKYHMAMVEKRSFDYAYPYLKAVGMNDSVLSDIRVMLITTDVSPLGDSISPVHQLRTAYEYHFGIGSDDVDETDGLSDVSEDLCVLKEDAHLCLLCVLLQEADIMNSAGVDYNITLRESIALSKEIGLSHSLPEHTLLFLETICKRKFLSDAARFLAEDNLYGITERVMDDYRDGNKSYS